MNRRTFIGLSGLAALAAGSRLSAELTWSRSLSDGSAGLAAVPKADHTIRIEQAELELAPGKIVSTMTYGGEFSPPPLRLRALQPVNIDIDNCTDADESIHWHGLQNSEANTLDMANECGIELPPHTRTRIQLTPRDGFYFYHSNRIAACDLNAARHSAQTGVVLVEASDDPGGYDREIFLLLKDFAPRLQPAPQGLEIRYGLACINGRMLGAGEPVRVRLGDRLRVHVLNSSATHLHRIALPQHTFRVHALDGYPLPVAVELTCLRLGPGERVSATIDMHAPGVWVLGATDSYDRQRGLGMVVEYAGHPGPATWVEPRRTDPRGGTYCSWPDRLATCGGERSQPVGRASKPVATHSPSAPRAPLEITLANTAAGPTAFPRWTINGSTFSLGRKEPQLALPVRSSQRLRLRNASDAAVCLHLQGHRFELVSRNGRATGVHKDIVLIEGRQWTDVDVCAARPGQSLLYCLRQMNRDFGLLARVEFTGASEELGAAGLGHVRSLDLRGSPDRGVL